MPAVRYVQGDCERVYWQFVSRISRPFPSDNMSGSTVDTLMMTPWHGNPLPQYWPARSTVDSPRKWPVIWCFYVLFGLSLNKLLNKQSSWWWFETQCRPCDVTIMPSLHAWSERYKQDWQTGRQTDRQIDRRTTWTYRMIWRGAEKNHGERKREQNKGIKINSCIYVQNFSDDHKWKCVSCMRIFSFEYNCVRNHRNHRSNITQIVKSISNDSKANEFSSVKQNI